MNNEIIKVNGDFEVLKEESIETIEELRYKMENKYEEEWSLDFLSTYYKVLARLIDNGKWHPDYRGYIDEIWYENYLKVKLNKEGIKP